MPGKILLMVLAFAALLGWTAFSPKPKVVKGLVHRKSTLTDAKRGSICRIDSGGSEVMLISHEHENPLFPSQSPNKIYAHLEFKNGIEFGRTYQLPDSNVQVCYYEKGDLLMFHTFSSEGSIRFDAFKDSSNYTGAIDLKFVRPHHNMSNSDYHYIGGKIQLKAI